MSARQQAREAIPCTLKCKCSTDASDVTSDIWEPIVRDLLIAYQHAVAFKGEGHVLDSESVFVWGAYTRAKEALG